MTERESFIRAICEQPDDDTPRLVFADWLDEQGNQSLAHWARMIRDDIAAPGGVKVADQTVLRDVVRVAWRVHELPDPLLVGGYIGWTRGFVSHVELPCDLFMKHAKTLFSTHPVTGVRLTDKSPGDWWYYHAPPPDGEERITAPGYLPHELVATCRSHSHDFDTLEEANAWLSERCVSYGRSLAGLPEWGPQKVQGAA